MFKKPKSDFEDIRNMVSFLRTHLFNKELLDYIINKLLINDFKNYTVTSTRSSISIVDKKSTDTFYVEIDGDDIITSYTCWNGNHHERKVIKFIENIVAVKEDESTNVTYASTHAPASTKRKTMMRIYKDNELIYLNEFNSETEFNLEELRSSSTSSETFISSEKQAVQKNINVGDVNAVPGTSVSYSATSSYEAPPFNDIACNQHVYMFGMHSITEEEFLNFTNRIKSSHKSVLQKLYPKQNGSK